jgi:hypothetical protein
MANSWSKEDRYHFKKSEVMQELEKRVIETVQRAEILQEKIAASVPTPADTAAVKEYGKAVEETTKSVEGMSKALSGADDDEVAEDALAVDLVQDEVINDLRDLVAAALTEGNVKLAYKIERTIDEILEQDIICE